MVNNQDTVWEKGEQLAKEQSVAISAEGSILENEVAAINTVLNHVSDVSKVQNNKVGDFNSCLPAIVLGTEEAIRGGNLVEWNLEEEITRIIETCNALGFDFHGRDDLVMEELRRRELKDAKRYKESVV